MHDKKDAGVQPVQEEELVDVPVQRVSESDSVRGVHSVGEAYVPQVRRSERQKVGAVGKAASI
jgi:hypothetical protein